MTTERLTVRHFSASDADELHAVCGDRRTMRYVGDGMTLTPRRCAEWIDESLADYATRGYGASALYVQGEALMAGYCGIVTARRRADPEIIYALRPRFWGQGLASELVPALLGFGFGHCGLKRLVATIRPENRASLRVVEKAGMHCAGEELAGEGILMLIYALEAGQGGG
ncbi:MAG: GNAT family N-acetyltransferase [Gammaproteobacteria bacterium]|nr:GNAT family N-acetyltransferase [Gammaproteobacteria bacterium]